MRRRTPGHQRRVAAPRPSGERGYVIALFAVLLTGLMVIAAFAVDVGGFYSEGVRLQRAADAAALAAVVWVPGDVATATTVARDTAARNGFVHGQGGVTVDVSVPRGNSVEVTITDPHVPTYFGAVVTKQITMARTARAEFTQPLAMGSPLNTFGNQGLSDPDPPELWASINAPYTAKENGDPFAVKCITAASIGPNPSCNTVNPDYRTSGYLYAIDAPADAAGRQLSIEVFDAGFYSRRGSETFDSDLSGSTTAHPPALSYEVYNTDSTPYDLGDNPSTAGACTVGPGLLVIAPNGPGYKNNWTVVCALPATANGKYLLRVKSSAIAGQPDQGSALANYSVRAVLDGTGAQPHLYGVGDMSIYTGTSNSTANFYLAEVPTEHAGKKLRIEMFDPGDGSSGDYFVSSVKPDGTTAACTYTSPTGVFGAPGTCRIQTRVASAATPNSYNGKWLTALVDLPVDYSCTNCWWKVRYEFGGTPTDRTVWRVSVDGDPIHLVR